ncbi:MAG: carboxypeptidase regulatory-like domain-containing protein, partial [Acidobacteriia bacterium]|nr:carboxypeptidase regulatory-like domain-containing protein [Terriglobia bacterium]
MYNSICLLLLLTFGFSAASAQTVRSTVSGLLTNEAGQPVPAASVLLVQEETGWSRTATSDGDGEFLFPLLAPGSYRLEVAKQGFRRHSQPLILQLNQELRLVMKLQTGPQGDSVEVTATRSLLKPDTASMGTVIDTRQIRNLPLDGRNFLELSLLAPGTVPAAQGSAGSARGDFALNVNGSREDGNSFLLDGVYNGDPKLNTFGTVAAVDAIREFEVVTSTYDASFGRNGGAQVSVVLQSGSNQMHGSAYEFFRNAGMDARNFFAPANEKDPRYQRNQFGFSLGGPIRRNRTFLFADYEGRRVREGITRVTNVPTALERSGDFSQSGLPYLIDPFTQQPFAGNRIPANRISPIGANIAALYPLPNRSGRGQNFVSSPLFIDRNDQFDVRLDHKLSQSSDLTVRYSFADRAFLEPFGGTSFAQVPGYGNDVPRRAQNLMAGHTHAFTPTLLNEFRAAFSRVASQ